MRTCNQASKHVQLWPVVIESCVQRRLGSLATATVNEVRSSSFVSDEYLDNSLLSQAINRIFSFF